MTEIIPAILPKSFEDLAVGLGRIAGAAPEVQIDLVDGVFAPERTWPYADRAGWEGIVSGEEGMPHWEDFDFQFDAMLAHPEQEIGNLVSAGGSAIVIHAAAPGARAAAEALQQFSGGDISVSVGIALLSSADPAALAPFEGLYDFVQVMGIARIGRQGEPFDERALALVAKIRAAQPDLRIQVDGGVSLQNARALSRAGANVLVAGSAIFGAEDAERAFKALYTEANAH